MNTALVKTAAAALALTFGVAGAQAAMQKAATPTAMTERATLPVKEDSKAQRGAPVRVIPIYNVTKVAVCLPGPTTDCTKR